MNIHQKILAVMRELEGIELVKTQGLKFKIIQHDDVAAALRPLYIKHGIDQQVSVVESREVHGGITTELHVEVAWVNVDKPEDRKVVRCVAHASSTNKSKATGELMPDDLGCGKALSYAVKMACLKNFALLSGDEDFERGQGKPTDAEPAPVVDVEKALNALASAKTPTEFTAAAELAAALAGRTTPEQNEILKNAWLAANKRVKEPQEEKQREPGFITEDTPQQREQTTAEKVMGQPGEGLLPGRMQELMHQYKNVRTAAEFNAARTAVSAAYKDMTPAQRQTLKECDESAERLLRAQQEAAQ